MSLIKIPKNTGITIAIYGGSKQGKTTLIEYLFSHYFSKSHICFLCSTTSDSKAYDKIRDKCIVLNNIYMISEMIYLIRDLQRKLRKYNYRFCFIFDDYVLDKNSKEIKELILTMRNLDISTIISLQDPMLLSKSGRSNINYCFFFRFNSIELSSKIIEHIIPGLFDELNLKGIRKRAILYNKLTSNFHFFCKNMLDDNSEIHLCKLKFN